MYVKVVNGVIEKFPYYVADIVAENPNISLPSELSAEALLEFNMFEVRILEQPSYSDRTQKIIEETTPRYENNEWVIGWEVIEKTTEEVAAYDNAVITFVRNQRNSMLAASDWRALTDNTLTQDWANYRQELRDITNQEGFPYNIIWPTPPAQ